MGDNRKVILSSNHHMVNCESGMPSSCFNWKYVLPVAITEKAQSDTTC